MWYFVVKERAHSPTIGIDGRSRLLVLLLVSSIFIFLRQYVLQDLLSWSMSIVTMATSERVLLHLVLL